MEFGHSSRRKWAGWAGIAQASNGRRCGSARSTIPGSRTGSCCEVIMTGHGRVIRARAAAPEALAAVDQVAEKLEHQLEKTKGLLINSHHAGRRSSAAARALQRPKGAHRLAGTHRRMAPPSGRE